MPELRHNELTKRKNWPTIKKQRRGLIREQLTETPEKSDRQIAAGLGVSHSTVGITRREMIDDGQVVESSTSKGADGKIYPRRPITVFNPTPREEKAIQNPAVLEVHEKSTGIILHPE